jgi:YegS/Rv2252/BmrU family lipid kinase
MHYRIIVNPTAGQGAAEAAVPQIKAQFRRHGLDFDLVRTKRPLHAVALTREAAADGVDVVVAAGGDGTANEVLNGLMQVKVADQNDPPALGMLCVGRGNDFAFGTGVPTTLEDGCATLAQSHRRTIDVGHVKGGRYPDGRYFGNGVGIGFDAVVGFEAAKMVHLHGLLAYLVAALKTAFLYYQAPVVDLAYNGTTHQVSALMVSIMNGRRMGGSFMMAPESDPSDGQFDLCIAREVKRLRIFGLIPHFMKGDQASQPTIETGRTANVVITATQGTLPAHADGETLCTEGQRLAIELLPHQIDVICDAGDG